MKNLVLIAALSLTTGLFAQTNEKAAENVNDLSQIAKETATSSEASEAEKNKADKPKRTMHTLDTKNMFF